MAASNNKFIAATALLFLAVAAPLMLAASVQAQPLLAPPPAAPTPAPAPAPKPAPTPAPTPAPAPSQNPCPAGFANYTAFATAKKQNDNLTGGVSLEFSKSPVTAGDSTKKCVCFFSVNNNNTIVVTPTPSSNKAANSTGTIKCVPAQ